jgi:hypothetical protein
MIESVNLGREELDTGLHWWVEGRSGFLRSAAE